MNQLTNTAPQAGTPFLRERLHPAALRFLEQFGRSGELDITQTPVEDARAALSRIQGTDNAKLSADIEDRTILVGTRGNTAIRIIRPRGSTARLPVVIYFHGGGWAMGDRETHDRLVREIAIGTQAMVVFVDYTRSPEACWPVAVEEGYAVCKWVFETGKAINMDPSQIAVAGDSAGGNIATVVALLAKERGGPQIKLQVLFYPVADANFETPSYGDFAQGYFLTRDAMKQFWDYYVPNVASRQKLTASPLRAALHELRGLPPTLIITAECDILRDEGEAYAARLEQADVPVTLTRYPGMIHDFVLLNALSAARPAREAIAQATAALRSAFAQALL